MKRSGRKRSPRRGRRGKRTKDMVRIARQRMDTLMDLSIRTALQGHLHRADRYAALARRIGMRYNVRMRPDHRMLFCRKCNSFMLPSRTQSIRIRRGRRIARCIKCGAIQRIPLGKELGVEAKRGPRETDHSSSN